jgi:hypothetical protein
MLSVPQSPNHYHTILILVQLQPSGESFSGHSELFSIFYSPLQQRLDSECGRSLIGSLTPLRPNHFSILAKFHYSKKDIGSADNFLFCDSLMLLGWGCL